MDYWRADEVKPIIKKYKKYRPDLLDAKFGCIFREKAQKSNGEQIVGKVTKMSDKYRPLLEEDYDFIMEIGADAWTELSDYEREAWIDHLLQHCVGEEDDDTGETDFKTRRPEIIAFSDTLDRHGVDWNDNLQELKHLDFSGSSSGSDSDSSDDDEEDLTDNGSVKKKTDDGTEDTGGSSPDGDLTDDDLLSDMV